MYKYTKKWVKWEKMLTNVVKNYYQNFWIYKTT